MSRHLFSEDRAKGPQNQYWCGAAKSLVSHCAAKRAFLFQICTAGQDSQNRGKVFFIRLKSLIGLGKLCIAKGFCAVPAV